MFIDLDASQEHLVVEELVVIMKKLGGVDHGREANGFVSFLKIITVTQANYYVTKKSKLSLQLSYILNQ